VAGYPDGATAESRYDHQECPRHKKVGPGHPEGHREGEEVRRFKMEMVNRFYDDVQVKVDILANHYPTSAQLKGYFEALYPDPPDGKNKRAENIRSELFRLFEEGKGQDIPGIRHSSWAAYHAVTEWVDHYRATRTRNPEERASRRLQSLWFGSGARLKAEAWDRAINLAS
jgi:hypothetical protein